MRDTSLKQKLKDQNLQLFFIFIGISVFCFLIYFVIQYNNVSKEDNFIPKKESSKEYIYTTIKKENPFQDDAYFEVPIINLEGQKFEDINQAIINTFNIISNKSEYDYSYEFNKSRNILALKITYAYYVNEKDFYPKHFFETFNIDLSTGKILTNDEILKKYHLNSNKVEKFLKAKFEMMYNDLVREKYYTEKECNYQCFLDNREISDKYLNEVSYYIDNGSLTLFKFFSTDSSYNEIDYFQNQTYQFIVKK